MQIDLITLFPEYFISSLETSIIKRASEKKAFEIKFHQIRDFAHDKHRSVDDIPYGGGAGMVMMPAPLFETWNSFPKKEKSISLVLSPRGKVFSQNLAKELSENYEQIIFTAGHYEGLDCRYLELTHSQELSLGDFVLTGGEAALVPIIDAVIRLLPGVLGNDESAIRESFTSNLLEHDQYTRPANFMGLKVPKVLQSGNHAKIDKWRKANALKNTLLKRPDLLASLPEDFFDEFDE